jgi:hypothetical protein
VLTRTLAGQLLLGMSQADVLTRLEAACRSSPLTADTWRTATKVDARLQRCPLDLDLTQGPRKLTLTFRDGKLANRHLTEAP